MTVLKYLIYNKKGQIQNQWICHKDAVFLTRKLSSLSSNFVFDSFLIVMKFCSLSSSFAYKEVLFAKFELRL